MIEKIKRGAGIQEGFEYQYWYGVKLLVDWKISTPTDLNKPPWLKQEIGVSKYGIFDDILMYIDDIFYFYQAKKSFSSVGGIISEEDLLDDESELSMLKMYSSYLKIKEIYPNGNFFLITVSNRSLSGVLREIIKPNENCIEEAFVTDTIRKKEKTNLRNDFYEKIKSENFEDFLRKLIFLHIESPEYDLRFKPVIPVNVINSLYNWIRKIAKKDFHNSENKISYGDLLFLLNLDNTTIPLRLGFYSKSEFPSDILYDYSLDFFSHINESLYKIKWKKIRLEVEDLRKLIIKESQNRFIRIEALCHLTIGFIIGFVFRSTTGFQIQVVQRNKNQIEIWDFQASNKNGDTIDIEVITEDYNKTSENLIICLQFTNKPVKSIAKEYLKINNIEYNQFKELIINTPILANQVSPLIKKVGKVIMNNEKIKKIHIFSAIPLGFALLLGYYFNAMPTVQLYEFDMINRKYIPSIILEQKTNR